MEPTVDWPGKSTDRVDPGAVAVPATAPTFDWQASVQRQVGLGVVVAAAMEPTVDWPGKRPRTRTRGNHRHAAMEPTVDWPGVMGNCSSNHIPGGAAMESAVGRPSEVDRWLEIRPEQSAAMKPTPGGRARIEPDEKYTSYRRSCNGAAVSWPGESKLAQTLGDPVYALQ
jgi:hypothetical protein